MKFPIVEVAALELAADFCGELQPSHRLLVTGALSELDLVMDLTKSLAACDLTGIRAPALRTIRHRIARHDPTVPLTFAELCQGEDVWAEAVYSGRVSALQLALAGETEKPGHPATLNQKLVRASVLFAEQTIITCSDLVQGVGPYGDGQFCHAWAEVIRISQSRGQRFPILQAYWLGN